MGCMFRVPSYLDLSVHLETLIIPLVDFPDEASFL